MSDPVATDPVAPAPAPNAAAPAPAADAGPNSILSDARAPADPAASSKPPEAQADAPAAPAIPETYEFTAPEGFDVKPEDVEAYRGVAKEAGLTQDQFNQLAAFHIARAGEIAAAPGKAYEAMQADWRAQVFADPAFAGEDGKSLNPEAQRLATTAIDRFGGDDLRAAFNQTGVGNHPAFVKAFVEMGRSLSLAAKLDLGKPATATPRGNTFADVAGRLYPNMAKQGA